MAIHGLGESGALLCPACFCYSWMTGPMGSNDEAVAFLHETLPASALQYRQADGDPDGLFPARTALPGQVDACAGFLADLSSPD